MGKLQSFLQLGGVFADFSPPDRLWPALTW